MADKRIRTNSTDTVPKDTVVNTNQNENQAGLNPQPDAQPNQYDSIMQAIEELKSENKELRSKVAEANWDISEKVKESKRRYWFNLDWTRKPEESFKFRYNCLMHSGKEKAVISTKTIWRPVNVRNNNTWKDTNIHDLEVIFSDNTKTKIDVLDYINQKFQYEEFVKDGDIEVIDGKKNYTFRTKNFWTFTVAENFIN